MAMKNCNIPKRYLSWDDHYFAHLAVNLIGPDLAEGVTEDALPQSDPNFSDVDTGTAARCASTLSPGESEVPVLVDWALQRHHIASGLLAHRPGRGEFPVWSQALN